MLELTPEQRQALDKQSGAPLRILDPVTHDAYFHVALAVRRSRDLVIAVRHAQT